MRRLFLIVVVSAALFSIIPLLGPGDQAVFRFLNRVHRIEADFTERGANLVTRNGTWGLRLEAYGYGKSLTPAGRVAPLGDRNRVAYFRRFLTEWYQNGPTGIEQGFTLEAPPSPRPYGLPLTLKLGQSGSLRGTIWKDRQGLVLKDPGGAEVLRYGGLFAFDAHGKKLAAWFEASGGDLLIRVDDAGAVYPVVIDPMIQAAKITASDGTAGDGLGASVALSGDTMIIGATGDENTKGAAYVFVQNGESWSEQQKLTASDGATEDYFGSVALSGDTAVVGAYRDTIDFEDQGSAYVFVRNGASWSEQQKLTASSDGAEYAFFGISIAVSGDTALVGASGYNNSRGAAYVFVRNGSTWTQQQKLTASDGAATEYFGSSVALSDDTALVGSYGDNGYQGSVYVFTRDGTIWSEQQKLTAADGAAGDYFGIAIALSGDTALVGADLDDIGTNDYQGSAYVFVKSGATWIEQQKLTASDGEASDSFGNSVALSGEMALIGAYEDNGREGSAYLFGRSGSSWSQRQNLVSADPWPYDRFGNSVALSEVGTIVAAYGDSSNRGAFYAFAYECGDGTVDPVEECDDGNNVDGDGCNATCQDEYCGDGVINDSDESCDDGNTAAGDGCDATCQDESCGDGIVNDSTEECDDGNNVDGDGCNAICRDEYCGDGVINDSDESCDPGGGSTNPDSCRITCVPTPCGNNVIDDGEECDDGNLNDSDGCDANCREETVESGAAAGCSLIR